LCFRDGGGGDGKLERKDGDGDMVNWTLIIMRWVLLTMRAGINSATIHIEHTSTANINDTFLSFIVAIIYW